MSVIEGFSEAEGDAQDLLDSVLPVAEEELLKQGYVHPYGGAITVEGQMVEVAAREDGGEDLLTPSESIVVLRKVFAESAANKEYKCTALVRATRVASPETNEEYDAIVIEIDHEAEYSAVVYVPYLLTGEEVEYGETFVEAGTNEVF